MTNMEANHANSSHLSGNHTSSMSEVQVYVVIWSGLLLLVLIILGILPNCALLLSARCKRQIKTWNYALFYNICICNIMFCVLWIPLNFSIVVTNYYEVDVHFVACYAHIAMFHLFVAVLGSSMIFLAVQRLSAIWSPYYKHSNNLLTALALLFSWCIGCVCAVYASVDFSNTYSYHTCSDISHQQPVRKSREGNHWAETILSLIYVAALASTSVIFLLLGLLRQRSLASHVNKAGDCQYQGMPSAEGTTDDERATFSHGNQQPSAKRTSRDEGRKLSGILGISKKVCLQDPKAEDIHDISDVDDDDDDDKFDLKMRMNLSRSKRSSGRRHTVANIGPSESNIRGRRGSMDDQRTPGHNYQYVRKWSVDIVALQDQLENPKMHPVPLQELVDFGHRNQKDKPAREMKEVEKKKEENNEETAQGGKVLRLIKEQLSEEGGNTIKDKDHDIDNKEKAIDKNKETNSKEDTTNSEAIAKTTVNGTKECNDGKEHKQEIKSSLKSNTEANSMIVPACSTEEPSSSSIEISAVTVKQQSHNNTHDDVIVQTFEPPNDDAATDEKEYIARVRRHLVSVWKSVCHMLVVLVCLLPVCVFLVVADNCVSTRIVLMTLLLLQCGLHPVLLVWTDPFLQQALHRLKLKATSLQCVCYCNIGKGKRCLARPPQYC